MASLFVGIFIFFCHKKRHPFLLFARLKLRIAISEKTQGVELKYHSHNLLTSNLLQQVIKLFFKTIYFADRKDIFRPPKCHLSKSVLHPFASTFDFHVLLPWYRLSKNALPFVTYFHEFRATRCHISPHEANVIERQQNIGQDVIARETKEHTTALFCHIKIK